ncbi:hypothetical protein [Alicyclobacillus kakegawensis]|uniref:hypothetical protein n=1 Tax=Alicyclobacillus kakegawensis TaxID=392012 RepID=UPI000830E00A|nr:hypothetical protein [Alicyclobacillus kakegawensis]
MDRLVCSLCGCDEWRQAYDYVPYGATVARIPASAVCAGCGADYDEFACEPCEKCGLALHLCECEEEEEEEA